MTWCVNIWSLYYKRVGPFFVTVLLDFCEAVDDMMCKYMEIIYESVLCLDGLPIYFRMVGESPWRHSIENRQTCEDIHICNTRARWNNAGFKSAYVGRCLMAPRATNTLTGLIYVGPRATHFSLLGIIVHCLYGASGNTYMYIMPYASTVLILGRQQDLSMEC
jgi:hypothetical protein